MPPDVVQSTTMSKKGTIEVFQTKISRNDRFAQMSHQEKLIEQKKREIQAKLEQKMKAAAQEKSSSSTSKGSSKSSSAVVTPKLQEKKPFNFNTFSNDGSFLNQFKQMKDKKLEQKLKAFKSRENHDRYSDDRNKNKWKRDNQQQQKDNVRPQKVRTSRFSTEKPPAFETKINISTSYANLISQPNFDGQSIVTAQDVTGQPLLKNLVSPQTVQYPLSPQNATPTTVIAAPPLLLNVPPPQIQLTSIEMVDLVPTTVITTVTLPPQNAEGGIITVPPPPCLPTLELSSIPPPNPIQVHNIPQPEPINTLAIPPPAPLQVQNIPPPSPIQLNEIPNPKPLDILSIPTPNEKNMSDPDFLKNVPPPNKSVPPPSLQEGGGNVPTCIPPPNVMPPTTMPPPPPQLHQNLLIPPPQPVTIVTPQPILQLQSVSLLPQQPAPNPPPAIPPLMSQTILPPPGLGIVPPPPINMNCPPPLLQNPQVPPPGFMNLPPPPSAQAQNVKDMNAGTADYEAMASLGRVVAQCGPGIEDFVRHRKSQDPTLWFLFHKESAAYRQYQQLIATFEEELRGDGQDYRPEDIYEPDGLGVEDDSDATSKEEKRTRRKKRKSRWGDKEDVPPPGIVAVSPLTAATTIPTGSVVLSKITRSDPGLLHYAANTFGSTNLSEEEWKKAEDHYKLNILYQDMVRKREEVERLKKSGQNKYEYDSDEDVDGGTWEHKVRQKEMVATQIWANELTRQAEGKHHIGDFLPPEEFKKFMEKSQAAKEGRQLDVSDYKEFKLKEDNIGFKMLQKLGWSEGTGLGTEGKGILEPVNKGNIRDSNQGLGLDQPSTVDTNDDEYDAYRKRMMLAYRFRPNPLNNPRRPYY